MRPIANPSLSPDAVSFHIPPKRNAAFQGAAELVQESESDRVVTKFEISRDSEGRVRVDWDVTPTELRGLGLSLQVAMILDHVGGKLVVLNPHSKTATRSTLDPPPEWNPNLERRGREPQRKLHGILCVGGRLETPGGGFEESWASEELGIVVASETKDVGSRRAFRFLELKLGDVDASLFQIPADYTIVDEP